MKKTSESKSKANIKNRDELRREYRFDYARAISNRFAERIEPGAVAVLLDPDVAQVFRTTESVNTALRALLTTMPSRRTPGSD
jgi:hypothetical protein